MHTYLCALAMTACNNDENSSDVWYQALFEHSAVPMLIVDRRSMLALQANKALLSKFGYLLSEWKNINISRAFAFVGSVQSEDHLQTHEFDTTTSRRLSIRSKQGEIFYADATGTRITYQQTDAIVVTLQNIEGGKTTEAKLRQTEHDLRQAQFVAKVGSFVWDFVQSEHRWTEQIYLNLDFDPVTVNPSYENFLQAVHPDDRAYIDEMVVQAIEHKNPYKCVHRVVWRDGSIHYMEEAGIFQFDKDGMPLKLIGTTLDVTEREITLAKLRQTQEDLQRAEAIGHVGTWSFDPHTTQFSSFSDEVYRILGQEVSSRPPSIEFLLEKIHGNDREQVEHALHDLIVDPSTKIDIEFRMVPVTC